MQLQSILTLQKEGPAKISSISSEIFKSSTIYVFKKLDKKLFTHYNKLIFTVSGMMEIAIADTVLIHSISKNIKYK